MFLKKYAKGIFRSVRDGLNKEGSAVLMYHSVGGTDAFFNVRPSDFKKQMVYLHDNGYNVVGLDRLLENPLKKSVVLTFDDGYADNYEYAWPVLKEYGFKATIFLSPSFVGKERTNSQGYSLSMLDWNRIKEMHESGIDFEPHGLNHLVLDQLEFDEMTNEIGESKRIIEETLGKRCRFFAYPKGRYNDDVIRAVKDNGLELALTVNRGRVSKNDDPFTIKRISINSQVPFFEFKMRI